MLGVTSRLGKPHDTTAKVQLEPPKVSRWVSDRPETSRLKYTANIHKSRSTVIKTGNQAEMQDLWFGSHTAKPCVSLAA